MKLAFTVVLLFSSSLFAQGNFVDNFEDLDQFNFSTKYFCIVSSFRFKNKSSTFMDTIVTEHISIFCDGKLVASIDTLDEQLNSFKWMTAAGKYLVKAGLSPSGNIDKDEDVLVFSR